jgi:hypothetical protein
MFAKSEVETVVVFVGCANGRPSSVAVLTHVLTTDACGHDERCSRSMPASVSTLRRALALATRPIDEKAAAGPAACGARATVLRQKDAFTPAPGVRHYDPTHASAAVFLDHHANL